MRFFQFVIFLCLCLTPPFAYAQMENTTALTEKIQIIVTTSTITIDTNFTGRDVHIAGVLENADPRLRLQNRYDIIVVMEGPVRAMVMREKRRKMGVWVNADSLIFRNVPLYYSMATTRQIRDITSPDNYEKLGLGLSYLPLRSDRDDPEKIHFFTNELIEFKVKQNLYSENIGAVSFGSASLFMARFQLPANVPVGQHKIHAYLFRDGEFLQTVSTNLEIVKSHLAYTIYREAHYHSLWYGITAVFVAVMTGFIGRFIFRKKSVK